LVHGTWLVVSPVSRWGQLRCDIQCNPGAKLAVEACDQTRKEDICCRRLPPPLPQIWGTRTASATAITSTGVGAVIIAGACIPRPPLPPVSSRRSNHRLSLPDTLTHTHARTHAATNMGHPHANAVTSIVAGIIASTAPPPSYDRRRLHCHDRASNHCPQDPSSPLGAHQVGIVQYCT